MQFLMAIDNLLTRPIDVQMSGASSPDSRYCLSDPFLPSLCENGFQTKPSFIRREERW